MSSTLKFQSFVHSNIRERSELLEDASAEQAVIRVKSTEGFESGQSIYLGELGREGCEKHLVATVDSATDLTLTSPLERGHSRFSAVTAVLGDRIRIYRAVNVTDVEPDLTAFTASASRSIKADSVDTYYTDASGSSGYWYRHTYFNELNQDETELDEFPAVRGDDYARYASNDAIRKAAGFEHAENLSETVVDQARRTAEVEVNSALTGVYQVPFVSKVPPAIRVVVEQLAAGFLLDGAFPESGQGTKKIKEARESLKALKGGTDQISVEDGGVDRTDDGVTYYFGPEDRDRDAPSMGIRF